MKDERSRGLRAVLLILAALAPCLLAGCQSAGAGSQPDQRVRGAYMGGAGGVGW
jgi:hypothetical protein